MLLNVSHSVGGENSENECLKIWRGVAKRMTKTHVCLPEARGVLYDSPL